MQIKEFAVRLAKESGKFLMENFGKEQAIRYKAKKELVTEVDIESERRIIEFIHEEYPKHNILSEETGSIKSTSEDYTWLVDPLDGTLNYFVGMPLFGVSIALACQEVVNLGVIYLPYFNQLFCAERGRGAFLNGKKLKVSDKNALSEVLMIYDSKFCLKKKEMLNSFGKLISSIFKLRMFGAGTIELASVSSGRADLYIEYSPKPWDIAAGCLLVEEAGGKVTDFKNNTWTTRMKNLVASNGKIHDKILDLVKNS